MQFRLQTTQECGRIVSVLQQRGMEFQQQRPTTGRPSTGRPSTTETETRPLTMQTSSPADSGLLASGGTPKLNPFRLQTLEAGGLSSQSTSFVNPHSASKMAPRQLPYPGSPHKDLSASSSRSALDHTSGNTAIHSLPVLGLSTPLTAANFTQDTDVSQTPADAAVNPMTGANKQLPAAEKAAASDETWQTSYNNMSDQPQNVSMGGMPNINANYNTTTSFAPGPLEILKTLEREIPPRRELPFKRPTSHSSASSRPSTTTKAGHRSTTIDPSSERNTTSTVNTVSSRPATASSLKRVMAPGEEGPAKKASIIPDRPQTSTLPQTTSQRMTPASASARPPVPDATFRRPSDLGELLRSSKPLADRSPNSNKIARLDSLADCPYELETPPGTSSGPGKPAGTTTSTQQFRGTENEPLPGAATIVGGHKDSSDTASLARYAAQSQEDRQSVLDEFMVSKLEDPNFAILCEDLDSCWRRIALGL